MEKFIFKIPGINFDPFLFAIFILLPMITSALCLFYAFTFLKRARTLENTPFSKIRSAAQSYIELKAKAMPLFSTPVLGALSQKPCVWYRYRIEVLQTYYRENETISRWEPVQEGASTTPFLLNDETGECVILPQGAAIITNSTLKWYGNSPQPKPYPSPSFWTLFFGEQGKFCYIEERLELNTLVYATGIFHTVQKDDPLFQNHPTLMDVLIQTGKNQLNILDNSDLKQKQSLLISALSADKMLRSYRIKAFLFFISFLFFTLLVVSRSYPTVMNSIHYWQDSLR